MSTPGGYPYPGYPSHDPVTGRPYSPKTKLVAGLLQILLPFGIGRFYMGHVGIGLAQLLLSCIAVGSLWSFIDGILILVNGGTDAQGRVLRDQ